MTDCISCERRNAAPSASFPKMCTRCWLNLPQVTRELYSRGGLAIGRVAEIAKERRRSVRELGGGSK